MILQQDLMKTGIREYVQKQLKEKSQHGFKQLVYINWALIKTDNYIKPISWCR